MTVHMKKILALIAVLGGFSASAFGLGCPQSSPELMRHLGRALGPSDGLASKYDSPTDEKIEGAITGINGAIQCSNQTLCEDGLSMLPERLQGSPERYREFMVHFVSLLEGYRALFEKQLTLPFEERNLDDIHAAKKTITDLIRRAHAEL